MKKIITYLLVLTSLAANGQIVNKFRDSSWFKSGVRFDSTLVFSKGAGNGKVWMSNATGTGSWQTINTTGVTQQVLNDSMTTVRGLIPDTSNFATKTALKDTSLLLRGLIPDVSNLATKTNLADTSTALRILIAAKGNGTVTGVTAGNGLSGGTISISGTLSVDTSVISTKANVTGLLTGKANQTALNDSMTTVRGLIPNVSAQTLSVGTNTLTISGGNTVNLNRKVDSSTLALNAGRDSLVFTSIINGTTYRNAVRDSSIATPTFSLSKNTARDSIVTIFSGVRSAVKDSSIATPTLTFAKSATMDSFVLTYNGSRTALVDSFSRARKVDTIYRTAGTDSIIFKINTTRYAIKDSTGGSTGWGLSGNAGTVYGTNFIGTSDNVGLNIRTNATNRMYITAAGLVGIGSGTSGAYPFEISTTFGNSSIETAGRIRSVQGADGYGGFAHYYGGGGNWSTFGTNSSGQTIIINGTPAGGFTPVITFNNGYGSNGNCGIGGAPVTSAKLALTSTTTGFLPPVMTSTQRDAISTPATGLMIFCSDCTATDASTGVTQTYNGSTWKNFW